MEDSSYILQRQGKHQIADEDEINALIAGFDDSQLNEVELEIPGATAAQDSVGVPAGPAPPSSTSKSATNGVKNPSSNQQIQQPTQQTSSKKESNLSEELANDPIEYVNKMEMRSVASETKQLREQCEIKYPWIFGSQAGVDAQQSQIKSIDFSRIEYISQSLRPMLAKRTITVMQVRRSISFQNTSTQKGKKQQDSGMDIDGRKDWLRCCTSRGEVIRFSKKETDPLILSDPSSQQSLGSVTCIDVRDPFLLVGYSEGSIGIFHLKKRVLLLPVFKEIHKSRILSVMFFDDVNNNNPEKPWEHLSDVSFLSSDRSEVMRTTFTKGLFSGFKPNSENYPDLFDYTDILKRYQRFYQHSSSSVFEPIDAKSDIIFRNAFRMRTHRITVSSKPVQLLILVTYDAIVILAESAFSRPMIVFFESRRSDRYQSNIDFDQIATVEMISSDILLIQWGCSIIVTQLKLAFNQISSEWCVTNQLPNSTRFYSNQTPILFAGCIRTSILFLIDSQNTCHILNYKKFAKLPYIYSQNQEQSLQAHIFKSHHLKKITKPILIKLSPEEAAIAAAAASISLSSIPTTIIKSYSQSLQILDEKIYILSTDNSNQSSNKDEIEIQEGEILRWEYQLDLKFSTLAPTLTSHISTLELCLQIFKGSNNSFGDVSTFKESLRAYICKKTKECFEWHIIIAINDQLELKHSPVKSIKNLTEASLRQKDVETILKDPQTFSDLISDQAMMKFMKFLVFTESWDFLFQTFFALSVSLGSTVRMEYLAGLVPFIDMQLITLIPSPEAYNDFSRVALEDQEQIPLLSLHKLIMNLNLKEQNFAFILKQCSKQELMLTPFTYLSTRIESDFITPLSSMMSSYQTLPQANSKNATPTLNKQFMGYRIMWFIRMSLSGLLFPGEQMDTQKWVIASNSVFKWIFLKSNIRSLLEIDPDLAFQNLLMFFRGYSSQIIHEHDTMYTSALREKLGNEMNSKLTSQDINMKSLITEMISKSIPITNAEEAMGYFYLFLGEIKDTDLVVDLSLSAKAALFLLENPSAHLFKNKDLILELEGRCRQIIKLIQPCIAAKQINLDDFLRTAMQSPFVEVCSYIYKLRGDYKSAIRVYVEASLAEIQLKVFAFLRELLDKQPASFAQSVFEQIMYHLPRLVEIDHLRTSALLKSFKQADIRSVLKVLADSKEELTFLLLKDYFAELPKNEDNKTLIPEADSQLYVDYIRLLAKLHQGEVLAELKMNLYDQDKVLEVLKGVDHQQGLAYLYGQRGDNKSALEIHLKLVLAYLIKRREPHARREFNIALDLLRRSNKRGDEECENNWFFWITGIQGIEAKLLGKKGNSNSAGPTAATDAASAQRMLQVQKNLEEDTFQELINHVQVGSILQNKDLLPVLSSTFSFDASGGRNKQLETLVVLLKSYSFEQKIFNYSKDILYTEYQRFENLNFKKSRRGFKMNKRCSNCEAELAELSEIRHYMCQHSFCASCVRQYCFLCYNNGNIPLGSIVFESNWADIKTSHKLYIEEQARKAKQAAEEEAKAQAQAQAALARAGRAEAPSMTESLKKQQTMQEILAQKAEKEQEKKKQELLKNRKLKLLSQFQKKMNEKAEYFESQKQFVSDIPSSEGNN